MAGDQNTPPPPTGIEPTSLYYLGPHDRPGDFITPTRLRGDNYDEWVADIHIALEARRKFVFLNGSINSPVLPCTQDDWNTLLAMLISWLMNTIDPEVKATLSKYKDAKRFWNTLKSRFSIINGHRIQQIKSAISKCEQTKTMSVATYFGKLTALWEELNNNEPLITCSCCTNCTAGVEHEKRRANTRLHQFLMGLYKDYYAQNRANILSLDPLPSLDRAYQLVIQEERVRIAKSIPEEKSPDVVGFAICPTASRGKTMSSSDERDRPDKSHLQCTHCKKSSHLISGCYELIGYPDWWPPNQSKVQTAGAGSGRQCQTAGKGRGGAGRSVRANAAQNSNMFASSSSTR